MYLCLKCLDEFSILLAVYGNAGGKYAMFFIMRSLFIHVCGHLPMAASMIIKPELFIGFAKNKKVGSLMNVCFIISTKTKSTLFPHLKKGKVPL